jgi:hypothetical protein
MGIAFGNPIVGGTDLIRAAIRSPNFSDNEQGTVIDDHIPLGDQTNWVVNNGGPLTTATDATSPYGSALFGPSGTTTPQTYLYSQLFPVTTAPDDQGNIPVYSVSMAVNLPADSGSGCNISVGLVGYAADKTTVIDRTGGTSISNAHWFAANSETQLTTDGWLIWLGYFSGTGNDGTQGQESPIVSSPGTLYTGISYVQLIVSVTSIGASAFQPEVGFASIFLGNQSLGWSINRDGTATFQQETIHGPVYVTDGFGNNIGGINPDGSIFGTTGTFNDLIVNGDDVEQHLLELDTAAALGYQMIARGSPNTNYPTATGTTEVGWFNLRVDTPNTGLGTGVYYLELSGCQFGPSSGLSANSTINVQVFIHQATGTGVTTGSPVIWSTSTPYAARNTGTFGLIHPNITTYTTLSDSTTYSFLVGFAYIGTATNLQTNHGTTTPCLRAFLVPQGSQPPLVTWDSGGSAPAPSPTNHTAGPFHFQWLGVYNSSSNNAEQTWRESQVFQGNDQAGEGNVKTFLGMGSGNLSTIQSDLTGASNIRINFHMKNRHWYQNSGGDLLVGTHGRSNKPNGGFSGQANDKYNRWGPNHYSVGASINLDISSSASDWASGVAKGIIVGPGGSNGTLYYGYFDGRNDSDPPYIYLYYDK